MEYSLELLRTEREKLSEAYTIALNKEPKDWDTIIISERLMEDIDKTLNLIYQEMDK